MGDTFSEIIAALGVLGDPSCGLPFKHAARPHSQPLEVVGVAEEIPHVLGQSHVVQRRCVPLSYMFPHSTAQHQGRVAAV